MAFKFNRSRNEPMSEINVTPFVDVMLVLLIIFMVTAPLLTVGVQVDLPESAADSLPDDQEPLTISINSKGEIYISGNPLCRTNWADSSSCPRQLRDVLAKPSAGCTAQCAADCLTYWSENDKCDPPCDFESCNYDNGKCGGEY